jgi:hypothetical protein
MPAIPVFLLFIAAMLTFPLVWYGFCADRPRNGQYRIGPR